MKVDEKSSFTEGFQCDLMMTLDSGFFLGHHVAATAPAQEAQKIEQHQAFSIACYTRTHTRTHASHVSAVCRLELLNNFVQGCIPLIL